MLIRTPSDLAALIRDRRMKLGLDQKSLAQKVGVSAGSAAPPRCCTPVALSRMHWTTGFRFAKKSDFGRAVRHMFTSLSSSRACDRPDVSQTMTRTLSKAST
jgi:hypothetical protein